MINVHRHSSKVHVILVIFYSNFNFLNRFFEKYTNTEFNENPSRGSRVVLCVLTDGRANGRTDTKTNSRKIEANRRFWQFRDTHLKMTFFRGVCSLLPLKLHQYNGFMKGRTIEDGDFDYRL